VLPSPAITTSSSLPIGILALFCVSSRNKNFLCLVLTLSAILSAGTYNFMVHLKTGRELFVVTAYYFYIIHRLSLEIKIGRLLSAIVTNKLYKGKVI